MSPERHIQKVLDAFHNTLGHDRVASELREAFEEYAVAEQCTFHSDAAGDMYVRCEGGDSGLSDLAIACPFDLEYGNVSMKSGLAVFSALAHENLACGLALIVHTSGSGNSQGDNYLKDECFTTYSAVFEVQEFEQEELQLQGNPLLISKAKKHAESGVSINASLSRLSKPVFLRIAGPSSEKIAVDTLRDYSRYIAALFENFD